MDILSPREVREKAEQVRREKIDAASCALSVYIIQQLTRIAAENGTKLICYSVTPQDLSAATSTPPELCSNSLVIQELVERFGKAGWEFKVTDLSQIHAHSGFKVPPEVTPIEKMRAPVIQVTEHASKLYR